MPETTTPPAASAQTIIQQIPVAEIRPSSHQVRMDFDDEGIKSLAESIAKEGLIQPITVRWVNEGYELVAGERRLRAVKCLGWPTIEARLIEVPTEAAASAKGLVENLQRQDLNPLEEAEGFFALNELDPTYWTHERIADVAGKDRTYITKSIGFLGLPQSVRSDHVLRSTFTRNHFIQLCRVSDPVKQESVIKAIKTGLTVEETRKFVDQLVGNNKAEGLDRKGGTFPELKGKESLRSSNDPLSETWRRLLANRAIDAMGGWVVTYKKDHWNFSVSSTAVQNKKGLAVWFQQMADQLNESAGGADSLTRDLMPSTAQELEQLIKEQRNLRLPNTPEEEAQLITLASQGPRLVYGWIYGENSLMVKKVGQASWTDLGIADPASGLKELLDSMRLIQKGELIGTP